MTLLADTVPFVVGVLNEHDTVSTVVPSGCSTVMIALVNATSVIVSVQFTPGQSGAFGIGVCGGCVVTVNDTLPFLISVAGIASEPFSVTGAGF